MPLVSVSYIFRVFIEGTVAFVSEGGSAVGERLFKIARAGVANNIKGVSKRDLRRRLIIYKLKGLLLLINSLISAFNYSIGLSL